MRRMQYLLALRWAASSRFVSGMSSASISATFASSSARLSGRPCHAVQGGSIELMITGSANAGAISGAAQVWHHRRGGGGCHRWNAGSKLASLEIFYQSKDIFSAGDTACRQQQVGCPCAGMTDGLFGAMSAARAWPWP